MRLKIILTSCFVMLLLVSSSACTTFFLHHGDKMVFGRNYDWMADAGMVCTNQRGLAKTSLSNEEGKAISWVSRYGSISFNQYGKEFPTGGMNEKGLVVELMWLDGTKYPAPDDRPAVNVLQWVQYQLDNCATIDDVIATDQKLRIISNGTPLHYLVADAGGHAASIEFLEGKMIVHKDGNLPMPVLTNDTYARSIAGYRNGTAGKDNSLERFSKACNMIREFKAQPGNRSLVDQSFLILDKVSQGNYTKWSIVYDITDKKIYFKTERNSQQKSVSFSFFDFSCSNVSRVLDINLSGKGDVSSLFNLYSDAENIKLLENSARQSSPRIRFTKEEIQTALAYPVTIRCK